MTQKIKTQDLNKVVGGKKEVNYNFNKGDCFMSQAFGYTYYCITEVLDTIDEKFGAPNYLCDSYTIYSLVGQTPAYKEVTISGRLLSLCTPIDALPASCKK